ncbi:MAG TPA: type I glyceraldehyde-3-phosphate dehydrogenase [Dehalococcoidia bacterium]|nr:type I glyceraldehyde-3-phosphate dehydrogenase [Dehalococcoidia bacterium]
MTTRIGINGFGRIGRLVTRAWLEDYKDHDIVISAVNGLSDVNTYAHLFKHDTTYGNYPGEVTSIGNDLMVDGNSIRVFSEREPSNIPWAEMGVDIVIESTGKFTDAAKAIAHIDGGASKVLVSAPSKGADATIVMGINDSLYNNEEHTIVSNASCTTNCFAPMVKVLNDAFGIEHGLMSTIHSFTNDQSVLDRGHKDLRRARSASMNIIPTTTGAARSVGIVIPELQGKLDGIAYRVPTTTCSATDFTANLSVSVTIDDVNEAFKKASETNLKGILEYTEEPLVSSDFRGNSHSCIYDALSTIVMQDNMVKVLGWYDNEWGYSCRTIELCALMGNALN